MCATRFSWLFRLGALPDFPEQPDDAVPAIFYGNRRPDVS